MNQFDSSAGGDERRLGWPCVRNCTHSTRCLADRSLAVGHAHSSATGRCLAGIAWDCVHQLVINHTLLPLGSLALSLPHPNRNTKARYVLISKCVCVCAWDGITIHICRQTVVVMCCGHSAYAQSNAVDSLDFALDYAQRSVNSSRSYSPLNVISCISLGVTISNWINETFVNESLTFLTSRVFLIFMSYFKTYQGSILLQSCQSTVSARYLCFYSLQSAIGFYWIPKQNANLSYQTVHKNDGNLNHPLVLLIDLLGAWKTAICFVSKF